MDEEGIPKLASNAWKVAVTPFALDKEEADAGVRGFLLLIVCICCNCGADCYLKAASFDAPEYMHAITLNMCILCSPFHAILHAFFDQFQSELIQAAPVANNHRLASVPSRLVSPSSSAIVCAALPSLPSSRRPVVVPVVAPSSFSVVAHRAPPSASLA